MMSFLSKKSIGIDIADSSIVIVQIESSAGKVRISGYSRVPLAPGIVRHGKIKDEERLKIAFKDALAKSKPNIVSAKKIIFGIPERRLFSHVFQSPTDQKAQLDKIALDEAKKNIPIEANDLLISYKIVEKSDTVKADKEKNKQKILLIGTSKSFIHSWRDFFNSLEIEVEAFDVETLAIFRGLSKKDLHLPLLILDMGAVSVNIALFDKDGLFYSHALSQAGDFFTQTIAEKIKKTNTNDLDLIEAERVKINFGLTEASEYKDVAGALRQALSYTIDAIKEASDYYHVHNGETVKDIVLVGGSSRLKGLSDFLLQSLSASTSPSVKTGDANNETVANAQLSIKFGEPILSIKEGPSYFIEAIGLAWRGLDKKWFKNDPYISFQETAQDIKKEEKENKKNEELQLDSVAVEENAAESWLSIHKKEIQLLSVLVIGGIFIGGAFWYRSYTSKQHEEVASKIANDYKYKRSFVITLPVNIDPSGNKSGQIRGRIIKNIINKATSYDTAIKTGLAEAKNELVKGEAIWPESWTAITDKNSLVFPLELDWLAYSEQDASSQFLSEVKKQMEKKPDFILQGTKIEKVIRPQDEESSIGFITATVTIMAKDKGEELTIIDHQTDFVINRPKNTNPPAATSSLNNLSNNNISSSTAASSTTSSLNSSFTSSSTSIVASSTGITLPNSTSSSVSTASTSVSSIDILRKAIEQAKQSQASTALSYALVRPTEIGWLKIRSGPETSFPIIKKALPGEKYKIIDENDKWVKLQLSSSQTGWASKDYIERVGQ